MKNIHCFRYVFEFGFASYIFFMKMMMHPVHCEISYGGFFSIYKDFAKSDELHSNSYVVIDIAGIAGFLTLLWLFSVFDFDSMD